MSLLIHNPRRVLTYLIFTKLKPWTISFEVENGTIYGNDRGYRYALIPKGDYKFRNPDDGTLIEFDLKNKKSIRMKLFDKYTFTKK